MIRGTLACHAMRVNANGTRVPMSTGWALVGAARYHPWHWVPASRPGRRESAIIPAGTTGERRHSGREAGIQAMEGTFPATSTPAVSFIGVGNEATGLTTPQGY